MVHISLLALPDSLASSLTLPLEMITAADQLVRAGRRHPGLEHSVVGIEADHVRMVGGLTLLPDASWREIGTTDLLILPALWRNPQLHLRRYPQLLPWLRDHAARGTRLCAVGTSSFFLAEAGLLDHLPATTHWFYLDEFARRYPQVMLKRNHLITEANGIYCAGSVNSVADLTVHFIGLFYGEQIARGIEAQFSPEIRRRVDSTAFTLAQADVHADELVIEAQDWLRQHYAEDIRIAALADHLQTSLRSLNRRFHTATGISPLAYLQQQRLNIARELLRTSNLSIAEVGAAIGYQDSGYFCRLFRQVMQQTPRQYRQAVRGKLFTPA